MIKVLILITTNRFSSTARLVVQTIEHCDQDRFSMLVGCTWQGGATSSEFFKELQRRKIPLRRLKQLRSIDPTPIFSAVSLVRKEKVRIIETHGFKACFIGFFLKFLTRRPWINVMHGHTAESSKVKLYSWLELKLARFADCIVTVSDELRHRLIDAGFPKNKTITIHNALDPSQFISNGPKVSRFKYGVADNEYLIGVIGRFSPEKGQDLFIESLRNVVNSYPQAKAIFLGEGPTENAIQAMVVSSGLKEHVIFGGYQPSIAGFYPLLDLVVIPSRSEGLPSVALEALYFGKPVVATSVGGIGEVIAHEKTGLLVPPEDSGQLASAIMRMISDQDLSKHFVAAGQAHVRNKFLPEGRSRLFASVYERLGAI